MCSNRDQLVASGDERLSPPALEATQGQMDGIFSLLPCKCHLEEVASVGFCLKICPQLGSRVATLMIKPNRPISELRFTSTETPKKGSLSI